MKTRLPCSGSQGRCVLDGGTSEARCLGDWGTHRCEIQEEVSSALMEIKGSRSCEEAIRDEGCQMS